MKEIIFYPISEFESLEFFLQSSFSVSKNQCKNFFSHSELKRKVLANKELKLPLNLTNQSEINPKYEGPEVKIIAENDLFLVLEKPKKIHVHPLSYDEKNNCLSFIRERFVNYHLVNRNNYDRGFLYRLDFETSGVLIYVKNEEAYHFLRNNFESIAKEKIYLAVVGGQCAHRGLIEHFIKPFGSKGAMMVEDPIRSISSHQAVLEILEGEYDEHSDCTRLKIKLKTGLRHQIRVQLKLIGFPIVGDSLYQGRPANELMLHAHQYQISYQNKDYIFTSKIM